MFSNNDGINTFSGNGQLWGSGFDSLTYLFIAIKLISIQALSANQTFVTRI